MPSAPTTRQVNEVELHQALTREFLLHHGVCPRAIDADGLLIVATTADPHSEALKDLRTLYSREVRTTVVKQAEFEQLVERLASASDETLTVVTAADDRNGTDIRGLANEPPVIRFVNMLVREAYDAAASDIHLEATPTGLTTRFRIDGMLTPAPVPPVDLQHAIVSRIKLLADLDIAERRRPQDGRIRARMESRDLDLRVSTVPTVFGESVALRLLDRGGRPTALGELGIAATLMRQLEALATRPHGLVLVSGPTGSGKTTTLYSCLQLRDVSNEKVITVEDPIEYQLDGVVQVPVHRQTGVTFGSVLRSILRQDPDVVMVGEMRDAETAEIAVQAALTGHLVLSTLHTNDAISAVPRLIDLGVPTYLVGATLEAVLAQRLVRRICDSCRIEYEPDEVVLALLTQRIARRKTLYRGAGCSSCRGTGFRGRLGVFELLLINDQVKDAIGRGTTRAELRQLALSQGMVSMREDGWQKVQAGVTTAEEVLRVTHT